MRPPSVCKTGPLATPSRFLRQINVKESWLKPLALARFAIKSLVHPRLKAIHIYSLNKATIGECSSKQFQSRYDTNAHKCIVLWAFVAIVRRNDCAITMAPSLFLILLNC